MNNTKTRPRNMGPGPNRGSAEKPKDLKKAVKSMIRYLDKYLPMIIVALVLAALSSVLSIIGPNYLSDLTDVITDGILTGINFDKVKSIAAFLLTIYLFSASFNYIQNFIMVTVSNNFAKDLRDKISTKINKLPLKYFDHHSYGDILSRVTDDVDMINQSMHQSLGTLVAAIALFIGSIIMMFVTNWILAITAIVSSLIGFSFMFLILGKSQKYFDQRQVELGDLNGHIEEIYSAHNVVKAYNGNKDASDTFDKLNKNLFTCDRKSQFLSGLMQPIMNFIGNFGYVCVCVVGAILTTKGVISFGVIVAFIIYVRLFTSPLSQIAQGMTSLQSTAAASERVFEFLEEDEMEDESNLTKKLNPSKVKGNIEFKHVKFGYNPDKIIIKDFNCKVKPGEKIAIVGPTGAGKTTMVNLLMKFYNITDGDIKIDGVSVKDLTRENIHDLFIMVLQDTWLFNGTIRDNIKYNKEKVKDEEIMQALKTVGVDHFVKSLPGVLNYEITDNESVSAGQKQLLTIARGMIKNAPFLILDEATSSVDTRTEELVQKAMDKLTEGRTSFIIAHRLSTIKNADLILVMNEGNIIEQGNHEELMRQNGFYAELYNSQFRK
ncbi:MAG TPA: ABC transporter ATP-binding protein [Candidatus Aphodocola excrementigallinarum]|uniref:ABC transporter ATP-binding protein n=1 Tax=Candidatus Aphodocola excrementigallinarum TaxID=2840670 RepID=A0A9D1ILX1_9FIRM|nr:ABC transporter ATP-binding protein [Candidatus Aphodocola excrementigallinarum]